MTELTNHTEGACTTLPLFRGEYNDDHAGVDTIRWQFRVNGAAAYDAGWSRTQELCAIDRETGELTKHSGLIVTAPYELKNGESCVSVEGRPVQLLYGKGTDELLPTSKLVAAEREAKSLLATWGLTPRARGVTRIDLTAALHIPDLAEQQQLMLGLLTVQAPRRRAAAHWGRDGAVETFYLKGDRGNRLHERVYPEGPKHKDRAQFLRWEAQTRWQGKKKLATVSWTKGNTARDIFLTKFGAIGKVKKSVTVATYPQLLDELVELAKTGVIKPAEFIRLSGWIGLQERGDAVALLSQPTQWRYQQRLAELGITSSKGKPMSKKKIVRVPVADYFNRLQEIRW